MELLTYGEIMKRFQESEIQFPEETALSVPVAIRRGDRQYDALFAFRMEYADTKLPVITRPFMWTALPADGGPDVLYSWCQVLDFVSADNYPLNSVVSSDLPRVLSPRKAQILRSELLEVYEHLRGFVFRESLSCDEIDTIVRYKELFLKQCYLGLYPFYYALSPAFFHWLRLPLPEMKEARITAEHLEPAKEYQYQLLILENLKRLVDQFQEKIMVDQHKQQFFDETHDELQRYRNGMLDQLTLSIERDVIQIIDALGRSLRAFESKEATPENYQRLRNQFAGVQTDLQDLLYRHGIDPYNMPGNEVDVSRQKVIATLPTGKKELDRKISARIAPGWEKGDRVIRPEHVSVYLYDAQQDEKPDDAAQPEIDIE